VPVVTAQPAVARPSVATADEGASYGPLGRLGLFTAGHFRTVLLAWVVVAIGFGVFAPRAQHALAGAGWEAPRVRSRSPRGS
jgi:RND superfamily putative drug exporter